MRISIMGDSISTYEGWNPRGYAVQYDGRYARENGLSSVDDTWWQRVLAARGWELVVNDAFSGSLVCGGSFPSASSGERAQSIAGTEDVPDAVLFYIGVNDFGYCAPLERFERDYARMLNHVAASCPHARLICATLMKTHVLGYKSWVFPRNQIGLDLDNYNGAICRVVAGKGAELADLASLGTTYETKDGVHPTAEGMAAIADAWLACLALEENPVSPEQVLEEALASYNVLDCGIVLDDDQCCEIAHDEREAPYAVGSDGLEQKDLLVSITDEGPIRLCASARIGAGSAVAGIGIDLASTDDWPEDVHGDKFARLLFTDREKELIAAGNEPIPMLRAKAFAAKEAAFKATAAPLRRWYEAHDEELFFEARDFELVSWSESRGAGRRDRAAIACEKMGIAGIEVSFCVYEGMAFCVAIALGKAGA